jgi:hypothetical protein
VEITDRMIEGMARWLCLNFESMPSVVTDAVRGKALAALNATLRTSL